MNHPLFPCAVGAALAIVLGLLAVLALRRRGAPAPKPLPTEWALTGRPVFSADERRIYRLLREALPHHIILSKLPLVRFCQPTDASGVRYWYDLLGTNHVTFAVCSANGRVLAAIDLDSERGHSSRVLKIKQSVLEACRVRYLVCPADHLPSIGELQLLVPHSGATARAPLPAPSLNQARDSLASTVAHRRAERTAMSQDSSLFQDSFFAMDSRFDSTFAGSDFAGLNERADPLSGHSSGEDIVGVVDDEPAHSAPRRR